MYLALLFIDLLSLVIANLAHVDYYISYERYRALNCTKGGADCTGLSPERPLPDLFYLLDVLATTFPVKEDGQPLSITVNFLELSSACDEPISLSYLEGFPIETLKLTTHHDRAILIFPSSDFQIILTAVLVIEKLELKFQNASRQQTAYHAFLLLPLSRINSRLLMNESRIIFDDELLNFGLLEIHSEASGFSIKIVACRVLLKPGTFLVGIQNVLVKPCGPSAFVKNKEHSGQVIIIDSDLILNSFSSSRYPQDSPQIMLNNSKLEISNCTVDGMGMQVYACQNCVILVTNSSLTYGSTNDIPNSLNFISALHSNLIIIKNLSVVCKYVMSNRSASKTDAMIFISENNDLTLNQVTFFNFSLFFEPETNFAWVRAEEGNLLRLTDILIAYTYIDGNTLLLVTVLELHKRNIVFSLNLIIYKNRVSSKTSDLVFKCHSFNIIHASNISLAESDYTVFSLSDNNIIFLQNLTAKISTGLADFLLAMDADNWLILLGGSIIDATNSSKKASFLGILEKNTLLIKKVFIFCIQHVITVKLPQNSIYFEGVYLFDIATALSLNEHANFVFLNTCFAKHGIKLINASTAVSSASKIWIFSSEFANFSTCLKAERNLDIVLYRSKFLILQENEYNAKTFFNAGANDAYIEFIESLKVFISGCTFNLISAEICVFRFERSSDILIERSDFKLEYPTLNALLFELGNVNIFLINNTFAAEETCGSPYVIYFHEANKNLSLIANSWARAPAIYFHSENSDILILNNFFNGGGEGQSDDMIVFLRSNHRVLLKENLYREGKVYLNLYFNNSYYLMEQEAFLLSSQTHVMMNAENSNILLRRCFFQNNGSLGQGAVIIDRENLFNLSMSSCVFHDNYAAAGAAVLLVNNNSIAIEACVFISSVSFKNGGAISANASASLKIIECTFYCSSSRANGGDVFLDNANENVLILNSVFLGSAALANAASINIENLNKNIQIFGCLFLRVLSLGSGVIYIGSRNTLVQFFSSAFLEGLSRKAGALIYLKEENRNISIVHSSFKNCYSFSNESVLSLFTSNSLRLSNSSIINCTVNYFSTVFNLAGGNQLLLEAVLLLDRFNSALILVTLENNSIFVNFLKLQYKLLRNYDRATRSKNSSLVMVMSLGNSLIFSSTEFEALRYFSAIFLLFDQNLLVFKRCRFNFITESSHLIKVKARSAGLNAPESHIILNQTFLQKSLFSSDVLHFFNVKILIQSSKISLKTNSLLLNGSRTFLVTNKTMISVGYSSKSAKLVIILTESQTSLYRTSFSFAPAAKYYNAILLKRSSISVTGCNFYFGIFRRSLIEAVCDSLNDVILKGNEFFNIAGSRSSVLEAVGVLNIEIITNFQAFFAVAAFERITTVRLSLPASCFLHIEDFGRIARRTTGRIFRLFHNRSLTAEERKNITTGGEISSLPVRALLARNFSGSEELDSFNDTFELSNISSKREDLNCYISVVGFDFYNNQVSLGKQKKRHTLKFPKESVELTFIKREFSYCLINATNLKSTEIERNAIRLKLNATDFFQDLRANSTFLELKLGFRDCLKGEVFESENMTCVECAQGLAVFQEYSGKTLSTACELCLEKHPFNCWGGEVLSPKPGFARASLGNRAFLICPNKNACLGDKFFSTENLYRDVKLWTPRIGMGLCLEGYTGLLCTECVEGYGVKADYKCERCDTAWFYASNLSRILLRIIILYASLATAIGINRSFERRFVEAYFAKTNFFLRTMINHIQVLKMLSSLPFYIPLGMRELFGLLISGSAPDFSETFTVECIIKKFQFQIPYQYFKIIMIYCYLIITLLFFSLFEYLKFSKASKITKTFKMFIKTRFGSLLILLISVSFVDIVKPTMEMFACVDLGETVAESGSLRLISQLTVDCESNEHRLWTLGLAFPLGLISVVILPIFITFKITSKKRNKTLFSKETISNYGFFYLEYEPTRFYYGFIVFVRKLTFILVQVFLFNYPGGSSYYSYVNASLLLLIGNIFFLLIQLKLDPYNKKFFLVVAQADYLSFIALTLSNICGLVWLTRGEDLTIGEGITLLLGALVSNVIFLAFWWWYLIVFLKNEMGSVFKSFRGYLDSLLKLIKADSRKRVIFVRAIQAKKKTSLFAIAEANLQKPIRLEVKESLNRKNLKNILTSKNKGEQLETLTESEKKIRLSVGNNSSKGLEQFFNEGGERIIIEAEERERKLQEKVQSLKALVYLQQKEINLLRIHVERLESNSTNKDLQNDFEQTREDLLKEKLEKNNFMQERPMEIDAQCEILKLETLRRKGLATINVFLNINNLDKNDFAGVSPDFESPFKGYFFDEAICPKVLQKEEFGARMVVVLKMITPIDRMKFKYSKRIFTRSRKVFKVSFDIDLRKAISVEKSQLSRFDGLIEPFDDYIVIKSMPKESVSKTFPMFVDVSDTFLEDLKMAKPNQSAVLFKLFSKNTSDHFSNIVIKLLEPGRFEIHLMFKQVTSKQCVLYEVLKKTFRKFSVL